MKSVAPFAPMGLMEGVALWKGATMHDLFKSIIAYLAGLLLIVSWGATAMFAVSVFFEPIRATPWFLAALGTSLGIRAALRAIGIKPG